MLDLIEVMVISLKDKSLRHEFVAFVPNGGTNFRYAETAQTHIIQN